MKYQVFIEAAARRFMRKAPSELVKRLDPVIRALAENPRPVGCRALAKYPNVYRVRVGDYRIVYRVEDTRLVVLVIRIGHRGDIYEKLRQ